MPPVNQLKYNKKSDNFETTFISGEKEYDLYICDIPESEIEKATTIANETIKWVTANLPAIKSFASDKLLTIKNDSWLEEDEIPLTEVTFTKLMELDTVTAFADGSLEIYFWDNDMFWGHSIQVSVDSGFVLADADITG